MLFTALSRGKIKFMTVQRADDLAVPDNALRQRPLAVGAPISDGENLSITRTKDRDFLAADDKTMAVAQRDLVHPPQINQCFLIHIRPSSSTLNDNGVRRLR